MSAQSLYILARCMYILFPYEKWTAILGFTSIANAFFSVNKCNAHISRMNRYDIERPLPTASFVREVIGRETSEEINCVSCSTEKLAFKETNVRYGAHAMIFYAARTQLRSRIFVPMCHNDLWKAKEERWFEVKKKKKRVRIGKDSNIFRDLSLAVVQIPVILLFLVSPPHPSFTNLTCCVEQVSAPYME